MFSIKPSDYTTLVMPPSAAANLCDNDGVLCDSEPYIQKCIIEAAKRIAEVDDLTPSQLNLIRSTFGQSDNLMSMCLFDAMTNDPVLRNGVVLAELTRETFVPYFIDARRTVWEEWTRAEIVEPKPFAMDYLQEFRTSDRLFSLVTGMPFRIAGASVKHILKADDVLPLTRDRRICCDDVRLDGRGKPDPSCYTLALNHCADKFDISPADMWVVEDRANGAVSALGAQYSGDKTEFKGLRIGKVIVIPDEHDTVPVELWDSKMLVENHLIDRPQDRARLFFLRSLEDLKFVS
jgi:beta-phosphoglucomutase-like phosphatase (HAD superfamily)